MTKFKLLIAGAALFGVTVTVTLPSEAQTAVSVDGNAANLTAADRAIHLTATEKDELVQFLKSL